VVDPRIYGVSFAPVLVALVVLMFSVAPIPEPLPVPDDFAADFDGRRAQSLAQRIVEEAPARTPGSEGDEAAADAVAARFGQIDTGTVTAQEFEGEFDGDDVDLRNVMLTLPGDSSRTVVVVAGRDSARGSGATSSAAATGTLMEMAANLGARSHDKTIVLVSADGVSEGGAGLREFIETYPTIESVDGIVVISAPGTDSPRAPYLLPWSTDSGSTSAQLVETATDVLGDETERSPGTGGSLDGLFRLAIPAGVGAQAVAIADGEDAIAISGAGEPPLDPSEDEVASLSDESLTEFGNAALALTLALDSADSDIDHGPGTHLELAGNLIPGWAIGLVALTLILPAVVTSVDGLARASRRREPALGSLMWALSRALPFVAALALVYLLALVGIAPDPQFPFDPGLYDFDWRAAGVLLALVATLIAVTVQLHPLELPPTAARETLATALGVIASLAVLGVWLLNPYLGLLCVPLAHVWLLAARPATAASIAGTLVAIAISLIPITAALVHLASRLDLGLDAPWTFVLMLTGGQFSLLEAAFACLIGGTVLGLLALAVPRPANEIRSPVR